MSFGIRIWDANGTIILDSSKNTGLVVDFVRSVGITTTGYFTYTFTDAKYAGCRAVPVTVYNGAPHTFNATVSGTTVTLAGYINFGAGGTFTTYIGAWIIKPTVVNT